MLIFLPPTCLQRWRWRFPGCGRKTRGRPKTDFQDRQRAYHKRIFHHPASCSSLDFPRRAGRRPFVRFHRRVRLFLLGSSLDKWCSACDPRFYADLAAKRLVYRSPERNEDAGGSMLRVLKFYQRGYRIPLDSLGAVIARLIQGVKDPILLNEPKLARTLSGLLREVDPDIDPNHIAHLPSETEEVAND